MKQPLPWFNKWLLLFVPWMIFGTSLAQQAGLSNRRVSQINTWQDSTYLTSFMIAPGSFRIRDYAIEIGSFQISGHAFKWNVPFGTSPRKDSIVITVEFRVLPIEPDRWTSRFDSLLYQDGSLRVMTPLSVLTDKPMWNTGNDRGIQYDGNFARGISVGNRQDLVLNSNFDLRLSGSLGEGIEVLAALSDNSIPLQPEGNTQQLQEFDRVFIQLTKDNHTLTGGDFELSRPGGYFINYFKKTQGVRVTTQTMLPKDRKVTTSVAIGGSRGKFARLLLPTREGNQGPYRLSGNSGERFIIVLAGTEKVYLDGILLVRGLEKDYVIDYNTGEITFTANRMITKDTRIIAEYEYSDQNYNRSILTADTRLQGKKMDLYFNAYSEQDGKLSSGLNTITEEDRQFLATVGDSVGEALASTVRLRPEGFDASLVLYKKVDTLGYQGILVRSLNPDSALYSARFTQVGFGNGDYIRTSSEINGEVYTWVAPDDLGNRQGDYAPVARLIAPQQRQMFAAGSVLRWKNNGSLFNEVSMSRLDQNRFSSKDNEDDYGYAIVNGIKQDFQLLRDSASPLILQAEVQHEYLSREFKPLNPYRLAEFNRDWNLGIAPHPSAENLAHAIVRLTRAGRFDLAYRYTGFFRESGYEGNKNTVTGQYQKKGTRITGQYDLLESVSDFSRDRFARPKFEISQFLDRSQSWNAGFYYEREKNARRAAQSDSLTVESFYYDLQRFFLRKNNEKVLWEFNYQQRLDYFRHGPDFRLGTKADDFTLRTRWIKTTASVLEGSFTIRDLQILLDNPQVTESGLTYVGKLNHTLNIWKGAFRTTTAYEIGSGQEPGRTFQFLRVDPGRGVYTFLDINNDGIQQVNEFEVAAFSEQAEYIRVTVLTNEFIPTNNINWNQSFSIDPRRILHKKEHFLARWSDQGSIRILRKNVQGMGISIWNPLLLRVIDSALVSVQYQMRNVLYFNRSNPKYDIQYEWNDFRNRVILTTGFEQKNLLRHILRSRFNLNRQFSGLISFVFENNDQDSESFENRSFVIRSLEWRPELNWQPSQAFRLTGKYRWVDKNNTHSEVFQGATIHDLKTEVTFSKVSTSAFRGSLALVLIDYSGPRNGTLEFTMLEGLKNGTNYLWNLAFDRRLVNNIRINLSYEGRKSGMNPTVHTARAQVSAFF